MLKNKLPGDCNKPIINKTVPLTNLQKTTHQDQITEINYSTSTVA